MKNIIKKMALVSAALSLGLLIQMFGPKLLRAVYDDTQATGSTNLRTGNIKITDTGVYDSAGAVRYQPGADNHFTGNTSISGGQESMGSVGSILSSLNTAGFSAGNVYYAYLGGTVAAVEGSALVSLNSVSNQIAVAVSSATLQLTNVVGVAQAAASTGAVVAVYGYGFAQALTTGTVVAGDALVTSSLSAGYLQAANSGTFALAPSSGIVAVALTAGTSAGGRTRVRLK